MLANEDDIKHGVNKLQGWEPYRQVMRDTAARHGIPLLSMVELFEKSGHSSAELFLDQMHPTVLGHQILGKELSRVLEGWALGSRLEGEATGKARPNYIDFFNFQHKQEHQGEEVEGPDDLKYLEEEPLSLDAMVQIVDTKHRDG